MKQVVLFTEGVRGTIYGIGTYIQQIIECLKNDSALSLHVVYLHSDVLEFTKENEGTYYSYKFPNTNTFTIEDVTTYYRNAWFVFLSELNPNFKDNYFFHLNYLSEGHLIPFIKGTFKNSKIIFTIHYQEWCLMLKGNLNYYTEILHKQENVITDELEKSVYNSYKEELNVYTKVDLVICLSLYTKRLLESIYNIPASKIKLRYNALKEYPFIKLSKEAIKSRLSFHAEEKIILFVGRLDEIKGVQTIIESFKIVHRKLPDTHLILAGDGNFSKYLAMCKPYWKNITFTGRLEREDLYELYQIADLGIMMSMHEQCSYVAIEMMMFGLPIIGTDSTGLNEMLEEAEKVRVIYNEKEVTLPLTECAEKMFSFLTGESKSFDTKRRYDQNYTMNNWIDFYRNEVYKLQ